MDAWQFLQLGMQWCQRSLQCTEEALGRDKMDVKSFFVLSAVDEIPHPAELARYLMMPKPTITFIIKKLEKLGYLKRKTVKGDLRKFEMVLTPLGRSVQERGRKTVSDALENSLNKLTKKERENYLSYLLKMSSSA